MNKSISLIPALSLERLKADKDLYITPTAYAGYSIRLKGSKQSIWCEETEMIYSCYADYNAMPLLRHISEQHNTLILGLFNDSADDSSEEYYTFDDDKTMEAVGIDFATLEMLNHAEEYRLSAAHIERITELRRQNREYLCLDAEYAVGEKVYFGCCGPDMTSSDLGTVIFTDKQHAIVRIEHYTPMLAIDFNRNTLSEQEIESIVGKPITELRVHEYDLFVDMMNLMTVLPKDIFTDGSLFADIHPYGYEAE